MLTADEARMIRPFLVKAEKKEREAADRFQDIIDGGEATVRQENKQMRHDEAAKVIGHILHEMRYLTE